MGETTDKIESYIDQQRARLGSDLQELEGRVRSAADWQTHFRNRPLLAIGAAAGGGALLAVLITRPAPKLEVANRVMMDRPSPHRDQIRSHWNQLRSAGIAMAVQRVVEYVDDIIPGFKEQIGKAAPR